MFRFSSSSKKALPNNQPRQDPETTSAVSTPKALLRRHGHFSLFLLLSLVVFRKALGELIDFSLLHDYGSHIIFVVPVSLYLIYSKRREIFSGVQSSVFTGVSLCLAASMAWYTAHRYSAHDVNYFSVEIAAIVLLWISGFILCYGWRAFRIARFPLFFLALMIPIPTFVLDTVTDFLQSGSAAVACWLFKSVNLPVHQDGFVIMLPTLSVEVAKQCSGIRSSLALLVTTLLVGHAVLRSPWRKSLLILSIVPIVILKNGVRIVTISLLTIYVNPAFLHGKLHTSGGVVFYLLALLALVPIIIVLKRGEINRNGIGRKIGCPDVNLEPSGLPIVHQERLVRP